MLAFGLSQKTFFRGKVPEPCLGIERKGSRKQDALVGFDVVEPAHLEFDFDQLGVSHVRVKLGS